MAKPLFARNIEFIKFLYLAGTNPVVLKKLKSKDFSVIDDYPKLSRKERDVLKLIDWKTVTLNFTEKLTPFEPGPIEFSGVVIRKIPMRVISKP